MKKAVIIIILIISITGIGYGQFYSGSMSYRFPDRGFMADSSGNILFKPGETHFGMEIGGGIGSNFSGNSMFSTWAAPSFSYNLSKRFRLNAGLSLNSYSGDLYYPGISENFNSPVKRSVMSTSVFVSGDYLLNNKIMLSGAAYKTFFPSNNTISDPRLKFQESQGVMLNVRYRPTEHFEINAGFEYGNGYSPYRSPFAPGGMYNAW
jgi:hypothetical protein